LNEKIKSTIIGIIKTDFIIPVKNYLKETIFHTNLKTRNSFFKTNSTIILMSSTSLLRSTFFFFRLLAAVVLLVVAAVSQKSP